MKNILVLGAGKSATSLIDYLLDHRDGDCFITVCDNDLALAESKVNQRTGGTAVSVDVKDESARGNLIAAADIVISLLPPTLHLLVAKDCIHFKKHLLTASYVDDNMKALAPEILEAGVLFLCEMGLDPGIDHMSAMKIIDTIKADGGDVTSFISHCGGLVAPESDDNPWHYKISWNPRNIVMAGKAGARFKEKGKIVKMPYEQLFDSKRVLNFDKIGWLAYYPNRDSLDYMNLYGLDSVETFMRTTLRYPEFSFGWNNLLYLKLTDEDQRFNSEGMTIREFYADHLSRFNLTGQLEEKMKRQLLDVKKMLATLEDPDKALENLQAEKEQRGYDFTGLMPEVENTSPINEEANKKLLETTVINSLHEVKLTGEQLEFLELERETKINKGVISAIDVLQMILEEKLALRDNDKDMIVMLHQIEYQLPGGRREKIESSLVVKGEDHIHTAMAKTVGLPLGIAAKLILENKINTRGLHIPIIPEIYNPVLTELESHGIVFEEKKSAQKLT